MKRRTYLEVILTVNAILLGGILWTNIAGAPALGWRAIAGDQPRGIPNAAAQRLEMIRTLRTISEDVRSLQSDLRETEFKVRLVAVPDGLALGDSRDRGDRNDSNADDDGSSSQVTRITPASDDSK